MLSKMLVSHIAQDDVCSMFEGTGLICRRFIQVRQVFVHIQVNRIVSILTCHILRFSGK